MEKESAAIRRDARRTIGDSVGKTILLMALFELAKEFVLIPVRNLIWEGALSTVPERYIGNANLGSFFRSPLAVLAAVMISFAGALFLFTRLTALVLCSEKAYRRETFTIWSIFRRLPKELGRVLKPKNWLMLLMGTVTIWFVDLYDSHEMMAGFVLPEYIMDVVSRTPAYYALYICAILALVWFVIRYMFAFYCFIVDGEDFLPSMKKSAELVRKRFFRTAFRTLRWKFFARLLLNVFPYAIMTAIYVVLCLTLGEYSGLDVASDLFIWKFMGEVMRDFGSILFTASVISFTTSMFHFYAGDRTEVPETALKTRTAKRRFWLVPAIYGGMAAIATLFAVSETLILEEMPELAEDFLESVKIVAHRGNSAAAPESTMYAFQDSIDCGKVDYIELDVHPDIHGVPVVSHDRSLLRTTGVNANIDEMTAEEIGKLDAGTWFGEERFEGAKVPTLEEVLDLCDGKINLIIEIKNEIGLESFEATVVRMMEEHGIEKTSVVHSLSYESLCRIKEANPEIRCGYIMAVGLGYYYDLPNADFFSIEHTFVTQAAVEEIHRRGKEIFVWTVNETDNADRARLMGVDGVIGDDPVMLYDEIHDTDDSILELLGAGLSQVGDPENAQPLSES